jgi:uroporphyrinogen-III decarboxylase
VTSQRSNQPMTNRERVLAVLHGETPDRIPLTTYDWKFPWGYDKRKLQERGLTMVNRYPGHTIEYPHCQFKTVCYTENGVRYEREFVQTPKGELTALFLPDRTCNVRFQKEFYIKSEADYEPLLWMIRDAVVKPAYEQGRALLDGLGEDGVVFVWKDYSPLQKIVVHLTGVERFCFELMDRPDQLWAVYDALVELDRQKTPIVVRAPGDCLQYCANPIAKVLGRRLFCEKVLTCTDEFADAAHQAGRLVSMHLDGDNATWADDVAASKLDIIEAFTPSPDTDMTMAQARTAFRDKIIWANFPSSVHLADAETIRTTTGGILDAVAPGDRFLLGITEDIPPDCWRRSLSAILDVIDQRGRPPLRRETL